MTQKYSCFFLFWDLLSGFDKCFKFTETCLYRNILNTVVSPPSEGFPNENLIDSGLFLSD